MASIPDHPNDAGTWTRLEGREGFALWRCERQALAPVTMYYVVAPPRQSEILYDEAKARARFDEIVRIPGATINAFERRAGVGRARVDRPEALGGNCPTPSQEMALPVPGQPGKSNRALEKDTPL